MKTKILTVLTIVISSFILSACATINDFVDDVSGRDNVKVEVKTIIDDEKVSYDEYQIAYFNFLNTNVYEGNSRRFNVRTERNDDFEFLHWTIDSPTWEIISDEMFYTYEASDETNEIIFYAHFETKDPKLERPSGLSIDN